MSNFTVRDIPSNLNRYVCPRRKKVGRKAKNFRSRDKSPILNRPISTYPLKFQHRLKFTRHIEPPIELIECKQEMQWLAEHGREYAGQWVALAGKQLLSYGENAKEVYEAARKSGIKLPLVVRVDPADQLPFGGW